MLMATGNSFAIVALLNFSFFLIPVSKHSPIMLAFNLPFESAVYMHQLLGRASIVESFLHGLLHIIRFYKEKSLDGFFSGSVFRLLFPPASCFCSGTTLDEQTGLCSSCCSGLEGGETSCYYLWRNFTGLFGLIFMLAILATSQRAVRRSCYRLFFLCHITFAPLVFLFIVWHWNRIYFYLLPSFTLYCVSFFVVHFSPSQCGIKVERVKEIGNSGTYEMVVCRDKVSVFLPHMEGRDAHQEK